MRARRSMSMTRWSYSGRTAVAVPGGLWHVAQVARGTRWSVGTGRDRRFCEKGAQNGLTGRLKPLA